MVFYPSRPPWVRPAGVLSIALLLVFQAPGTAQETESALSPAGRLRLQVAPTFVSWDSRYGLRSKDGATVEEREPLGFDLDGRDASTFFPGVPDLESRIAGLLADDEFTGVLGGSRVQANADRVRVPFRLDLGVLDGVTVGVTVPLVKTRTEIAFQYDTTGANLGANPAVTDPGAVGEYLSDLDDARAAARERATELCDDAPSSDDCRSATELAAELEGFHGDLSGAYGASFLFPTDPSPAGDALRDRSAALEQRLQDAGLGGFGNPLPLAGAIADREAFGRLLEESLGTRRLTNRASLWQLGDVEVHALVRLVEGTRRDSVGGPASLRWEVGAGVLVRLGTGALDDPAVVLDQSVGDGQTDVEGRLFANVTRGRLGLWTDARYGVQLSRRVARRVGPPHLPFRAPAARTVLEWTPGRYLQVEVAPRFHLTGELAVAGGYRLWTKTEDSYERLSEAPDPPAEPWMPGGPIHEDASLLALETEETRHELGAGLVYNTLGAWREGRAPLPLEGRLTIRWAVAGSGGQTPAAFTTGMALRLYHRLWGD